MLPAREVLVCLVCILSFLQRIGRVQFQHPRSSLRHRISVLHHYNNTMLSFPVYVCLITVKETSRFCCQFLRKKCQFDNVAPLPPTTWPERMAKRPPFSCRSPMAKRKHPAKTTFPYHQSLSELLCSVKVMKRRGWKSEYKIVHER